MNEDDDAKTSPPLENFDWGSDDTSSEPKDVAAPPVPASYAKAAPHCSVEERSDVEASPSSSKRKARPLACGGMVSRRKKKPKGMPKRPLSAYNIFFQLQRPIVLQSGLEGSITSPGKRIGFEALGKIIGRQWKSLTDQERKKYEELAEKDSIRYRNEMETFNEVKRKRFPSAEGSRPSTTESLSHEFSSSAETGSSLRSSPASARICSSKPPPILALPTLNLFTGRSSEASAPRLVLRSAPRNVGSNTDPAQQPSTAQHMGNQGWGSPQHAAAGDSGFRTYPEPYGPPAAAPQQYVLQSQGGEAARQDPTGATETETTFAIPPGAEISLPDQSGRDRKYKVKYSFYSMPRSAAQEYVEQLTGSQARTTDTDEYSAQPQQQQPGPQQQVRGANMQPASAAYPNQPRHASQQRGASDGSHSQQSPRYPGSQKWG